MSKLPLLSSVGILTATLLSYGMAAPSWANPVGVYYDSYRVNNYGSHQNYSTWIYGSPIPAPMPVNPVTGSAVNPYSSNVYVIGQPVRRRVNRGIYNSILVRPTIINSQISNSVIIDPRIVDRSPYIPGYLPDYGGYIPVYRHY